MANDRRRRRDTVVLIRDCSDHLDGDEAVVSGGLNAEFTRSLAADASFSDVVSAWNKRRSIPRRIAFKPSTGLPRRFVIERAQPRCREIVNVLRAFVSSAQRRKSSGRSGAGREQMTTEFVEIRHETVQR